MLMTVQELMESIAFNVNGDTTVPESTSDEYQIFLQSINQTYREWSDLDNDWEVLRVTQQYSLAASGTTLSLPTNFVKLWGFPQVGTDTYEQIDPENEHMVSTSSKYCIVDKNSHVLKINPALSSPMSVTVSFRAIPSALTSLTQTNLCPSDQFIINGASSKILLNRENPKYTEFDNKANQALQQMIGIEASKHSQYDLSIKSEPYNRYGFVLGED